MYKKGVHLDSTRFLLISVLRFANNIYSSIYIVINGKKSIMLLQCNNVKLFSLFWWYDGGRWWFLYYYLLTARTKKLCYEGFRPHAVRIPHHIDRVVSRRVAAATAAMLICMRRHGGCGGGRREKVIDML